MSRRFEVGQRVVIEPVHRYSGSVVEGEIVRVARKYATVATDGRYSHERRFDMNTGYEHSPGGYSANARMFTREQLIERDERRGLVERLKACGLRFEFGSREDTLPITQLRAVVEILEGAP